MAREWTLRFVCGHQGCNESANYRYQTKRDMMESFEMKNYSNGRWLCIRHSKPNEVLSGENLKTRSEVVSEIKCGKLFFGHFGTITGQGFKAFADDFPEGTRLVVTAEIILP